MVYRMQQIDIRFKVFQLVSPIWIIWSDLILLSTKELVASNLTSICRNCKKRVTTSLDHNA